MTGGIEDDRTPIDEDFLDSLAEDALSLFRINLVVLTIFATVILFVVREMDQIYYLRFFSSIYTLTGILFWAGSVFLSAYNYYVTRRARVREYYKDRGVLSDELLYLSSISSVAFGSVVAIISLIFGLLDGFSDAGIGLEQPIIIIGLAVVFVMGVFNLLSAIEVVRQKVPNWVWDVFYGDWMK